MKLYVIHIDFSVCEDFFEKNQEIIVSYNHANMWGT